MEAQFLGGCAAVTAVVPVFLSSVIFVVAVFG